jgi:hypothetical protein
MDTHEHDGFIKEAGLKQLAGRVIKSVGSALGSSKLQRKGMTMQHGMDSFVKTKVRPKPGSAPKSSPSRMQLVVPHDTPKAQRDLMSGSSKAKPMYVQPHGARRKP